MARCDIPVVEVAPCQCLSFGGHQTTSPARISTFGPPSLCTHPHPCVTTSVCPSGCQCHADLAPGSKVTSAQLTRAGSAVCISGSTRTLPVKFSSGPLAEVCEPLLLISIAKLLLTPHHGSQAGHSLDVFGVSSPLHVDLRGGAVNLAQVVGRKLDFNRADVLLHAAQLRRTRNRSYPRLLCDE